MQDERGSGVSAAPDLKLTSMAGEDLGKGQDPNAQCPVSCSLTTILRRAMWLQVVLWKMLTPYEGLGLQANKLVNVTDF